MTIYFEILRSKKPKTVVPDTTKNLGFFELETGYWKVKAGRSNYNKNALYSTVGRGGFYRMYERFHTFTNKFWTYRQTGAPENINLHTFCKSLRFGSFWVLLIQTSYACPIRVLSLVMLRLVWPYVVYLLNSSVLIGHAHMGTCK